MNRATALRRLPQQDRSRATVDRIVGAAEQLMRHRGSDDFTLAEVCKLGKVSMGSIYDKFESKDHLIHAVHARMIVSVNTALIEGLQSIARSTKTLDGFIIGAVETVAETLRQYAPILRPMMHRSSVDQKIAETGHRASDEIAMLVKREILVYRDEITHPNPTHAASAAYSLALAALARFLGLGTPRAQAVDVMDWHSLKQDVTLMCLGYLKLGPELAALRI